MNIESSSTYLKPEWLNRFYIDDEYEEAESYSTILRFVGKEARSFIWSLSRQLKTAYGVAGQSCHLVERYISSRIKNLLISDITEWERTKQEIKHQIPIIAAVCIQLTAKMSSCQEHVTSAAVSNFLLGKGIPISTKDINDLQFHVYQMLGFRIPLWTNVEKAQMLAREVGMTGAVFESVHFIVDISEFNRITLQQWMRCASYEQPTASTSQYNAQEQFNSTGIRDDVNVRDMHFVAGAVMAAALFMQFAGPDPVPQLANYTHSTVSYIRCIGNTILSHIIECGDISLTVKRTLNVPESESRRKRPRVLEPIYNTK